jgi:hypothetical protein
MRPQPCATIAGATRRDSRSPVAGEVVGGDDVIDDLVRHLPETLRCRAAEARGVDISEGQPRIVDQDIDTAETGARLGDDPVAFTGIAQIGDQGPEPRGKAERAGRAFHFDDVAVDMTDRDDAMPALRQPERHRPAKTAQPAGDDRDPLFHLSLL